MELSREEIIKALECCVRVDCKQCPVVADYCSDILAPNFLTLYKELTEANKQYQTENMVLSGEVERLTEENENLRAELASRPPKLIITKVKKG